MGDRIQQQPGHVLYNVNVGLETLCRGGRVLESEIMVVKLFIVSIDGVGSAEVPVIVPSSVPAE